MFALTQCARQHRFELTTCTWTQVNDVVVHQAFSFCKLVSVKSSIREIDSSMICRLGVKTSSSSGAKN